MLPPATIPAHPPPPSESTTTSSPEQQQQPPPPPAPPSGVESEAPPKRRKVEEVGFQRSPYYTIRETVANLRGCVLQVCQGTESQKKDAAVEILKEMKDVMELSKKARLGLSSAAKPVKLFEKPAAKAPEDKPAGNVPSAEKSQVPPTSLAGNFVHSIRGDLPIKPDNSDTAGHMLVVETKKGLKPSKTTDHTKQQGGLPRGSYVIGGSPIGWNFLMWPGCKAVYYGLTKAEWLVRRSAR
ncbi:hypothetical protein PAHAL_7G249600 [Panicum hallii]|uniref:Uncharacterized protein n=1 Tax=Panicum hallii TaxID=206008 RepID=A0A2S3I985_9POAL|nr:lysine-specific demethylase phf2-like [Panicum hallii]PAN39527.1 hypothetical protein PAHAL_7G249600 [Panicum hallii]